MILFVLVFYPMVGALLSYIIGRRSKEGRNYFADFIAISEFLLLLYAAITMQGTDASLANFCGLGLHLEMEGFRGAYTVIAGFMWMMTTIFSREYFAHYRNRNRYYLFQLVTLGATVGVFLSASLYTSFIFFEIMSLTSYVWVAQDERKVAMRAAETYLAVAIIGGLVLLMGLFLLYASVGTLEIDDLYAACSAYPNKTRLFVAGICMLVGFGAKAGAFPMHIWLPKAHPVAPAPASALLSGILTKAGVYGVLVISCQIFYGNATWGELILILGLITMFLGALLALCSMDFKRTLACSSMSQIGFILVGIGMMCLSGHEDALSVWGTFLHMMNHSLFKLVLFMVAGVVFMNIHKLDLNDIRGFGRGKPLLNIAFLMGALGIGGIPLWSGYISKTLLHEGIVEYSTAAPFKVAEWIFLISGGLTVAYMTKLYICIFVEKNRDESVQSSFDAMNRKYMNKQSAFAIAGSMIVIPILGMTPYRTMMPLAEKAAGFFRLYEEGHIPHFFSWHALEGGLISIGIGALIYIIIVRKLLMNRSKHYVDVWPSFLDLEDLVYRPILLQFLPFVGLVFARVAESLVDGFIILLRKTIYKDMNIPHRTGRLPRIENIIDPMLDWMSRHLGPDDEEFPYRRRIRRRILLYRENRSIIRFSLSYGLELAGIGLVVVLVYLLLW